jgi:hypothetical protein
MKVSFSKIISWSSAADALSIALAQRGTLGDELLEVADTLAAALRQRFSIDESAVVFERRTDFITRYLADVDRVFDNQSDNAKLVVWASYAVIYEGRESDEVTARLRDSDSDGNLISALRLRFENIDNQAALRFAEAAFGPLNSGVVANWIGGVSIFSSR